MTGEGSINNLYAARGRGSPRLWLSWRTHLLKGRAFAHRQYHGRETIFSVRRRFDDLVQRASVINLHASAQRIGQQLLGKGPDKLIFLPCREERGEFAGAVKRFALAQAST